MTQQPDWLHRFPPLRTPRFRRVRYSRDLDRAVVAAVVIGTWRVLVVTVAVGLWIAEAEAWLAVWFYWGAFLGLRRVWRAAVRAGSADTPDYLPPTGLTGPPGLTGEEYTQPWPQAEPTRQIDTDQWDGPIRRRRN